MHGLHAGGAFPLTGSAAEVVDFYLVKQQNGRVENDDVAWEEAPQEVDEKDKGTPDEWLLRNPKLVRLTGRHPFNCEAPLRDLFRKGFITPSSLHYVRSHGSTPRGSWESHRISIGGLAPSQLVLTMDELVKMPHVSLPVTLVCCGNRRKEQNMIKQTIGFNWGAAGVSTGVWTGVPLTEILKRAGITPGMFPPNTMHIRFASEEDKGGDKLPPGVYGTSVTLEKALDPSQDIIVAFMYNGRLLDYDHGFPVRIIIPGFIGGRMIKWLTNIDLLDNQSQDYYHFYDNRVLPPFVDAERAKAEDWWHKPEYICNDLNINSAIACPDHDEVIAIPESDTSDAMYTMQGYAYTGGGRKITRCEVSLNSGADWRLADLKVYERPNAYGKYWCWAFWSFVVPVLELASASEVVLRAWDESTNTQPDKPTWNLMGMLNNPWFRIKIHRQVSPSGQTASCIRFEHPTMAGNVPGGWMARMKEHPALTAPGVYNEAQAQSSSQLPPPPSSAASAETKDGDSPDDVADADAPRFTLAEVKEHASEETGAWIVVRGKVYACAPFLKLHPGGADSILIEAGSDATESFEAIHSAKAWKMLKPYYIGELVDGSKDDCDVEEKSVEGSVYGGEGGQVALDQKRKIPFKLVDKEQLSPDSFRLRFALQTPTTVLGLPVGQHMLFSAKSKGDGKLVMRAYTPVSSDLDVGFFELVIKAYYPQLPAFPEGGKMSQLLCGMQVGDWIDVRGPLGHVTYVGQGLLQLGKEQRRVKHFAMLCAGTGITPIFQVLAAVLRERKQGGDVRCHVVYANRTENDILLRRELDDFAAKHPSVLKLQYVLSAPKDADSWRSAGGLVGRVTPQMVAELVPKGGSGSEAVALLCGPEGFQSATCVPALKSHGYTQEDIVVF